MGTGDVKITKQTLLSPSSSESRTKVGDRWAQGAEEALLLDLHACLLIRSSTLPACMAMTPVLASTLLVCSLLSLVVLPWGPAQNPSVMKIKKKPSMWTFPYPVLTGSVLVYVVELPA